MSRPARRPFTQDDDNLLMKYIAVYNPGKQNRMGNALYKQLVEDSKGRWPWAKRHPWKSWREKYKDNEARFDARIRNYQKKKGIVPTEKKDEKLGLRELERRTGMEVSDPNGNASDDTDFSSPEPPTIRRLKKQPASHQNGGEAYRENEEPRPENELRATQPRRTLATRPARKTAVVAIYSEAEEGEIRSIRSIEEGEIVSEADVGEKKRKADETPVPSGYKRQRMQSDVSATGPAIDMGSAGPKPTQLETRDSSQSSPSTTDALQRSSQSKTGNIFNDKRTLALFLEALQSEPEGQQATIEFLKSRLYGAEASSSSQAIANNEERLYPQLKQEDHNITGSPATNNAPESRNRMEEPVTSTPADLPRLTNGTSSSKPVAMGASATPKASENSRSSESIESPPKSRPLVAGKAIAEDYFETPPPSPQRVDAVQPGTPSPSSSKANDHDENKENNPVANSPASQHNSPQYGRGQLASSFVPTFRKPAVPRRKAPDLDSGSETDVILDEAHPIREMNRRETTKESWPPLRKKKSSEVNAAPPIADSGTQRTVAKGAQVPPTMPPITKTVEATPKKTPSVTHPRNLDTTKDVLQSEMTSTSTDKLQTGTRSVNVPDVKSVFEQKRKFSQPLSIQPERAAPIAGSFQTNKSALRPTFSEKLNRTEAHGQRLEAQSYSLHSASASISTESDPFLTKEHARLLRRTEKGKAKEIPGPVEPRVASEANARADRRKTFAGFPTLKPPEIDLRKKALRTSVAGNPSNVARRLSFSPSVAIHSDGDQDGEEDENRIRQRASVKATIDLSREFPSPDVGIPPTDHAFIMRAGIQVLLQSIAQNHSVSEDFVRGIYEELLDLQATDRVVSKMRHVAERTIEEELEREKRKKRSSDVQPVLISQGPSAVRQEDPRSSSAREVDVSAVSDHARGHSASGPRRSELLITPADEDPTFVRLRNQYVPPSASRAARFVRRRARRSSGLASSPLRGYENAEKQIQIDDYEDDEKEEEEVFMALTPGRMFDDSLESFGSDQAELELVHTSQNTSGIPGPSNKARETDTSILQLWTAEEDDILLLGEDEEAIKSIEQRRGKRAVKWRIAELSAGDPLS